MNLEATLSQATKVVQRKAAAVDSLAVLTARLPAGTYFLHFTFDSELGEEEQGEANSEECALPNLYLSLALTPLSHLHRNTKAYYNSGFPFISLQQAMKNSTELKLREVTRSLDIPQMNTSDLSILASYPLQVITPTEEALAQGKTGLWELTFTLRYEFIALGGFALLLQESTGVPPTSLCCRNVGKCVVGHRSEKNAVTLQSAITPGNYTLWVVYLDMTETEKSVLIEAYGDLIPFSISVSFVPLIEREDRFNCEAGRLPVSLNSPGYMDKDGFLSYHDHIYADISSTSLQSHLSLPVDSVLRLVTVEPAGVGVDVQLLGTKGEVVAVSESVGGTEGILVELRKGEYTLEFGFANTIIENPGQVFCETFLLEMDIMPLAAAQSYISAYSLSQCRDDSAILTSLLDANMKLLNRAEKAAFTVDPDKHSLFLLPIQSQTKGNEVVFTYLFTLQQSSYVYFEVLSHPVLADLTVTLQRVIVDKQPEEVFGDFTDTLSLSRHSRRFFHGSVNSGQYQLTLKTGPGARNKAGNREKPLTTDEDFKVIPKCVSFQLKVEVLHRSEALYKRWTCGGSHFSLAPNSLNTVDKLGAKGINQEFMPKIGFFGQKLLPPIASQPDEMTITVATESVLRVNVASEDGSIGLHLKQGGTLVSLIDASDRESVILGSVLQPGEAYTLVLSFSPANQAECATYDMNLELRTALSLKSPRSAQACKETLPTTQSLVRFRTLEATDPQFAMTSGDYSSSLHDSDYQYYHGQENGRVTVPFEVRSDMAVVTAHLQAGFVETGLRFCLEAEDGAKVATGRFESASRMESFAVVLTKGRYSVVFEEAGKGSAGLCNGFSAAVLVEGGDQWSSAEALMRKSQGCSFLELPGSLNSVGALQHGQLHWHRDFPLYPSPHFSLELVQASVLHLAVQPLPDIFFVGRIFKVTRAAHKLTIAGDATQGIHTQLEIGKYTVEITYGSDSDLPQPSECPQFTLDLQIVPLDIYEQLVEAKNCSQLSVFPASMALDSPINELYSISTSAMFDHTIRLDLAKDSILSFALTFESALIGPIYLRLYDYQGLKVKDSYGVQDYSSLSAAVPAGIYTLRLLSTVFSGLDPICSDLSFTAKSEETALVEPQCEGAELPTKLFSQETAPFGGPQARDGSLSFYGDFQVLPGRASDKVLIRVGEHCIARILTLSNSPHLSIQAILYRDPKLTRTMGYSQSEGRVGSFILSLEAKYEPYVLELAYLKAVPGALCVSFQLAIEIQSVSTIREKLDCRDLKQSLPASKAVLWGKSHKESEMYAIRSDWIIGSPGDFPPGVVSIGVKNSAFVYQKQVALDRPGKLSVVAQFDFLTNDIYLQLLKGDLSVSRSYWVVERGSTGQDLELASSLETGPLEAGAYTLVLRQAVAANHLVQMFEGEIICFPFSLSMEFDDLQDPIVSATGHIKNRLKSISPASKSEINPSKGLALLLNWERPIDIASTGSLLTAFFLQSDDQTQVHPTTARQVKAQPHLLELTFQSGLLEVSTCYQLAISTDKLQGSGLELDLGARHEYCTEKCACNPKAAAHCGKDSECICSEPYAGVTCEKCIVGYTLENGTGLCVADGCGACPDSCVNSVCGTTLNCECGEFGTCVGGKCRCEEGFTGATCAHCLQPDLVFPDCTSCSFDSLPQNITHTSSKENGKIQINDNGEFSFKAQKVAMSPQAVSFRLSKSSKLEVEITGQVEAVKMVLTDKSRRSLKTSAESVSEGRRSLAWLLQPNRVYSLAFKGKSQSKCDSYGLYIALKSVTVLAMEEEGLSACSGHGTAKEDGYCDCDLGYTGGNCAVCDIGYESESTSCVQFSAPAAFRMSSAPLDSSYNTPLLFLLISLLSLSSLYYLYSAQCAGRRKPRRLEDLPEDEERVSLRLHDF